MVALLLAIVVLLAAGCGWLYRKWRHEQWEHSEECRLLRKREDSVEQRASDLETRVDRRILEVGVLNDQLADAERALKAERANRLVAEDETRRTGDDLQAVREDAEFWKSTAAHWQEQYEKANADAIAAREMVSDWLAQRTFGQSIFHKAPALPAESLHRKPIPRTRIQGRLAVRLAEQQFVKEERALQQRQRAAQSGRPAEVLHAAASSDPQLLNA